MTKEIIIGNLSMQIPVPDDLKSSTKGKIIYTWDENGKWNMETELTIEENI